MPVKSSVGGVDEYNVEYDSGTAAIAQYGSGNTTYSFRIGSCLDLKSREDRNRMFDEFTDSGMPVYIFGVTNNAGNFNESTRETYLRLRMEGKNVMLGQWTSPRGATYRDVVVAMSGIALEQALKYKQKYGQAYIVVIGKNDSPRLI